MARQEIKASHFSTDIQEFFILLTQNKVKYLIIGGEAVIYYGHARLTGDVDFYYERSENNAEKLFKALEEFWSGDIPGVDKFEELLEKGTIIQFGRPPNRIDLINDIEETTFAEAWISKETVKMNIGNQNIHIYYIGLELLIQNKEYVKRPKDLEDLKFLRTVQNRASMKITKKQR